MPLQIKCPSCSTTLKVPDSAAGKNIRCPKCKTVMACPAVKPKSPSAPQKVATKPATKAPAAGRPSGAPRATTKPPAKSSPAAARSSSAARSTPPATRLPASSPAPASSDPFDLSGVPLSSGALPPSVSPAAGSYYSAPKSPASRSIGSRVVWILVASVAGTFAFFAFAFAMYFVMSGRIAEDEAKKQMASSEQTGVPSAGTLPDRFRYSAPPSMPAPQVSELALPANANAQLLEIDLGAHSQIPAPGFQTQIRIYKPNSATQPGSAICVLVPPAGTPLMHGTELGLGKDNDYHDEALPYVAKGMIVVQFSLDGWVPPPESFRNEIEMISETGRQLVAFENAHAGMSNARIALDYALAHIPEIDPTRIFVAGHSSAGTLALQLATAEPRLAGALAYAPVTDLQERLGEALTVPMITKLITRLSGYIETYNPAKLEPACPLFVFHAMDDDNEPYAATQRYVSRLKQNFPDLDVTFAATPKGGHYQPMIDQGIPGGIGWILKRK